MRSLLLEWVEVLKRVILNNWRIHVGVNSREFLCELSLIVPEARPNVIGLISWIYRQSWGERLLEAEIQGRKDDAEEKAFLERLRKTQSVGQEG